MSDFDFADVRHRLQRRATSLQLRARDLTKRVWMRFALRGARYSSDHERVELAYKVRDPWQMESERERYRFQKTNEIIEREIGRVGSVLEIGCGEGHQTRVLEKICDRIYGFDVSATAVERARERCPGATLASGDVFSLEFLEPAERFDLVVACEVLYYFVDLPEVIARMNQLGRRCLVTYYHGHTTRKLAAEFARLPAAETTTFSHGNTKWTAVWWNSPDAA